MRIERARAQGLLPLVAGWWVRRAGLVALVASLVLGVVVMHAMNGPSHHAAGGRSALVVVATASHSSGSPSGSGEVQAQPAPDHGSCHDGCGSETALSAMCLMILVSVVGAARPRRRALPWGLPTLAVGALAPPLAPRLAPVAAPSLIALGISRT
ncbi:hypothetical protein [Antribacter gilvus]|uniref:hypothetical protein n=1 Tax=Antribacter gilvus TaxID=2304675 RepID=UPI000F794F01|nr:hypothetical protein [Antribacter gilvus]